MPPDVYILPTSQVCPANLAHAKPSGIPATLYRIMTRRRLPHSVPLGSLQIVRSTATCHLSNKQRSAHGSRPPHCRALDMYTLFPITHNTAVPESIAAAAGYGRGARGTANGLVPTLRLFNAAVRCFSQGGGGRCSSFAMYLEPWHADVFEFLELR